MKNSDFSAEFPHICNRMATILVIEDDAVVRASLDFALEAAGCTVYEADTATNAGQLCSMLSTPGAITAVVVDLHLPDTLGTQLLADLRQRLPDLPAVLISTDPHHPLTGCQVPLDDPRTAVLAKPFSARRLLAALERVVKP